MWLLFDHIVERLFSYLCFSIEYPCFFFKKYIESGLRLIPSESSEHKSDFLFHWIWIEFSKDPSLSLSHSLSLRLMDPCDE